MKKRSNEMIPQEISPIKGNLKHQTTPVRQRRKTSRKDQATDVHSSCSTPNRIQSSNIPNSSFNSPSDSYPYSQDNRPDVVWDYTSPKLPLGSKKKEIKLTVDEFLKNLPQVPEGNSHSSHYIKLLEKWMTKQNTPITMQKPPKPKKRDNKKRSRRVIEEIRQFMESIQKKKEDPIVEIIQDKCLEKVILPNGNASTYLNKSLNRKSFLEGDSNENDSTDDLWGDVDNSFIIKATQQLEVCSNYDNCLDSNLEVISTIPETISSCSSKEPKRNFYDSELLNGGNNFFDSEQHAQILLTQIINCDWDDGSDNDEWDNGFIEEDDALSLIPDELLCGIESENHQNGGDVDENKNAVPQSTNNVQSTKDSTDAKVSGSTNRSEEISFGSTESERVVLATANLSEAELFTNFDEDSFGDDEAILCKPEVLSWIDEVESKLSQSQPKCTPEEIKKKKDVAIQKRKAKAKR